MEKSNNQNKLSKRKERNSTDYFEFGKVPPHSLESEQALIGACLIDKNAQKDVMKFLKYEMFYDNSHSLIFKAIQALYERSAPIDIFTVVEELKSLKSLDMAGGMYNIAKLSKTVASIANVEYLGRIVFQKYIQRKLIEYSHILLNESFDDGADIFDLMEKFDHYSIELRGELDKPDFIAEQIADEFIKELDSPILNKVGSIFINRKIGFPSFDKIISWAPNKLLLLAGSAKDGKTKLISMMVFQLLKNDKQTSVYWVTLEDTRKDIFASYLAQHVYEKPKNILTRIGMNEKRKEKAKEAANEWKKYDLAFHDESITIGSIKSKFKAWAESRKDKFKVLVIDNLLALADKDSPNFVRNQNALYDHIIGTCSDIKRDTKAFIFLLHHFRDAQGEKGNIESGYRPFVSDIKGSEASRRIPNYILLMNTPSRKKDLLNQYHGKKREILEHLMIIDPAAIRDEDNVGDKSLIRLYADLNYTHFFDLNNNIIENE